MHGRGLDRFASASRFGRLRIDGGDTMTRPYDRFERWHRESGGSHECERQAHARAPSLRAFRSFLIIKSRFSFDK